MNVSAATPTLGAYEATFTRKNLTPVVEVEPGRSMERDTVHISDEARAAVTEALSQPTNRATIDQVNPVSEGDLPVEACAMPSWYGDYVNPVVVTVDIDYNYWNCVGKLEQDSSLSQEERREQIKNYLEDDPTHQKWLAKKEFTEKYQGEIQEYLGVIGKYFQESLKENEVNTPRDYYEKVVLDKNNSEKVRQSFITRVEADPRALELMGILGVKVTSFT